MQRKHPDAICEKCDLHEVGRFVPSVGPKQAKLAFVGEAPGKDETFHGEPFTGPSGQLLNVVMKESGINRTDVVLSNACLCRPPNNDTPSGTAISCCRPRLIKELEERGIKTVVTLGNSATKSLLGYEGITKLRVGPPKGSKYLPGARIIPTFHPAACLRNADSFPYLVTDMGKIAARPTEAWELPRYVVSEGRMHALALIDALWAFDKLVIDIETGKEKDDYVERQERYPLLAIGVCFDRNRVVVFSEVDVRDKVVLNALAKLFKAKSLIMHNGKSDCSGMYPTMGDIKLWFDTMLAHYCIDERSGRAIRGLGILGQEVLGYPDWKSWIKPFVKDGDFSTVPRDLLYKYNAVDCQATWDLYELYKEMLGEEGLTELHDFLVWVSNELKFIEMGGMAVDEEYNEELSVEYLEVLEKMVAEINAIIFPRSYDKKKEGINPNSPKQITEYFTDNNLLVTSTDADTIKVILSDIEKKGRIYRSIQNSQEIYDFCTALLKHRKEQKLYSTYVKGLKKKVYKGRVYPNFLLHGTDTGRLSCQNPNLQNVVRSIKIKKQFIPSPGNVFVQADYGQAELRVITWLAQEPYFRDIFNGSDRDVFLELGYELYGEEYIKSLSPEEYKDHRARKVKPFVYGLSYGRTAYAIALENDMPLSEAEAAVQKFFAVIPNIVKWQSRVKETVLRNEDLVTPFGRHHRVWLITAENKKDTINEALAFLPQSIASDICLRAAVRLRTRLAGIAALRNIVHDSILAECAPGDAEEVAAIMNAAMVESAEELVGGYVKFTTDYKIGSHWGEV